MKPRLPKKLIEVAMPLTAINKACAREKSIRHGTLSNLHRWWARRPMAAARAVIFGQMVDDPSTYVDVLRADAKLRRKAETVLKARLKLWEQARALAEKAKGSGLPVPEPGPAPTLDEILADRERQRLFRIIEDLVLWENTTNETVLQAARDEIWQSWRRTCLENVDHPQAKELFDRHELPAFHDPFAGGGALPLEAQRLGMESYASDLNPVPVLINKAMIEIPPKFAGNPPVNPESREETSLVPREWNGAQGLAEDVRYYGQWMHDEAEKRIGHLYPKVEITAEMAKTRPDLEQYVGQKLTVIAWLWARTVKSSNPAFAQVDVPLVSNFMLSTKKGKEAYVEPVIENGGYRFTVKVGKPPDTETTKKGTKLSRGANFRCLMSETPMQPQYIKDEGKAERMGARLMAIVAAGKRGRVYLDPTEEMERVAGSAEPGWRPDQELNYDPRAIWCPAYGLTTYADLFTSRQLVAMTTLSDLVIEAREQVKIDALEFGFPDEEQALYNGGTGATGYAEAVSLFLSLVVSKTTDSNNALCPWEPAAQCTRQLFKVQAIPMLWDYAEANPLYGSSGGLTTNILGHIAAFGKFAGTSIPGHVEREDAATQTLSRNKVVSTDPPYYDNVPYADLSDFFFVWLRRSLRSVFPDLFATLAVPKVEELVASPSRHGGMEQAEAFFLDGMTEVMRGLAEQSHPTFPVTIYYAFKQSEKKSGGGISSTGWETFLDSVCQAGFSITGTWPMRTEMVAALKTLTNSLASSIVLVCRKRTLDAPTTTRREFITALKAELPAAIADLQHGNIAPVDLAQAAIGPGMAIYTRYSKVLDTAGKPLTVRDALSLINQTLDEALAEQEGDLDADSRWALTWFEQAGFDKGEYGVAETLATARNTSVSGLREAGVVVSSRGEVRLLEPKELPTDWDPKTDSRLTAWEIVHHLIRVLGSGGEDAAAELIAKLGVKAEVAREFAYRLYTICEREKRPTEALAYNSLVQTWPELIRLARESGKPRVEQTGLFAETEE